MRRVPFLLALVLVLVGCATQEGDPVAGDPPRGTNAPAETVTVTVTAEAEPAESEPQAEATTETPSGSDYPAFGETYQWSDGIAVTIGPATPFTPSAAAAGAGTGAHVMFDVTVVNGTSANYEPAIFSVSMQSGNTEASQVFDVDPELGGAPSTVLLPGREVTFKIGFAVADPADLVMEVQPGFEYDPAIFTS